MRLINRLLGKRTLFDKRGKIVGEEIGLGTGLKNLAGFLLRREVVLPVLVGMLCFYGGKTLEQKKNINYHPRQAVVYEGEVQIDNKYQLLSDPNSPDNRRIYKSWDQFNNP